MPPEHVEMLALRILFDHSARTHRETGANLDVLQLVFARSEGAVESVWLAMRRAIVQPHPGFDEAGGVFWGDPFTNHLAAPYHNSKTLLFGRGMSRNLMTQL
jgi:hypothetical protein